MDPDANLEEQVALAAAIMDEPHEPDDLIAKSIRLADLVLALNQWLAQGGHWPQAWLR